MAIPARQRCPFEIVPDEEEGQIEEITDITVQLLDNRYPGDKPILRGVHPKSHGCVRAIFVVNDDIEDDLKVGLFSSPGKEFQATIRFSNAAALVLPDINDGKHGSRGMAIKVHDVGGEVLLDDKGNLNQDFLMVNQPVFAFANTQDYLVLSRILLEDKDMPDRFFVNVPKILDKVKNSPQALTKEELRILRTAEIVDGIQNTPNEMDASPLAMQYFSAAPFMFGDAHVMKFSAKPVSDSMSADFPENPEADYLRAALSASMKEREKLAFSFMVQVRPAGDDLGIDNASSDWKESDFPFRDVATITIPTPQDDLQTKRTREVCEKLEYNPWHSLKEHQPIGSINRLRESVYLASAKHRRPL